MHSPWFLIVAIFFCIDINGCYGYGTFENGRLRFRAIFEKIIGRYTVSVQDCSSIVIYKDGFVAFQLPTLTDYDNGHKLPWSNKWGIFKFTRNYFKQLTPFVLETALLQTNNPSLFICCIENKSFFVEYNDETDVSDTDNKDSNALLDEYKKKSNIISWFQFKTSCFRGNLKASFVDYKEIDCRKDGLFNIYTVEGCGLADDKQKVLVQAIYDEPIERYEPYMIVMKGGYRGLIGANGKELIPCKYEYIQVGSGEISVWKQGSDYNETTGECDEWEFCDDCIELDNSNENFDKQSLLLIGINLIEKDDERRTAKCDVYLADYDLLFSCEILPYGGLKYLKELDAVVIYGEKKHEANNDSFYGEVRFFLRRINDFTPYYSQAIFIDETRYMVYDNGRVGIIKICSDTIDKLQWVIPCDYEFMSLPVNGVLYAVYWDGKSVRLDLFDLEDGVWKFCSVETETNRGVTNRLACMEELYSGLNLDDDVIGAERLVGKNEINSLKYFPFQTENGFYDYDRYQDDGYSIEDSLRDAFDDEPEAMWGIMD